jgi:hypothetical protein
MVILKLNSLYLKLYTTINFIVKIQIKMTASYSRTHNPQLMEKILSESMVSEHSKCSSQARISQYSSNKQFEMTIDMGDGREFKIPISKQDEPLVLARRFCFENNLDMKIINVLAKKIKSYMNCSLVSLLLTLEIKLYT